MFRDVQCPQRQISCQRLDNAVCRVVSSALLDPQIIISALESQYAAGPNAQLLAEIDYIKKQISDIAGEDEDLYRAYRAHAFDADEYAARRDALKERRAKLEKDAVALQGRVLMREKLELNKQRILKISATFRAQGLTPNPPFEIKQTILKLVVEKIKLNVDEGWFEIEGMMPGRYEIDEPNQQIVSIPIDTDS